MKILLHRNIPYKNTCVTVPPHAPVVPDTLIEIIMWYSKSISYELILGESKYELTLIV